MNELWHIDAENFERFWPDAAEQLAPAFAHAVFRAEMSMEQLRELARTGRVRIVMSRRDGAWVGAAAVEFLDYPAYRAANVLALGGKHVVDDPDLWGQFRAWLKREGASVIEATCREAVANVLRWRVNGMTATFVRGEL